MRFHSSAAPLSLPIYVGWFIVLMSFQLNIVSRPIFVNALALNDQCVDALPVVVGPAPLLITFNKTLATSKKSVLEYCFKDELHSRVPTVYPSLWLKFNGTGGRIILARACPFYNDIENDHINEPIMYENSHISIFTGGCNSTLSQCVAHTIGGCEKDMFNFKTTIGTTYYAVVTDATTKSLTFGQSIDVSIGSAPLAPHDQCVDALPMVIGSSLRSTQKTIATFATIDLDVVDDCLSGGPPKSRGIWFNFNGTGKLVVADACTTAGLYSSISMSVFTGGCNSTARQCVASTNETCGSLNTFIFETTLGTLYQVLVQVPIADESRINANVSLWLFSAPPAPHDRCVDALPVVIGSSRLPIVFDIQYAIPDLDVTDDCFNGNPRYPGIWLNFTGTGGRMEAKTVMDARIPGYKSNCYDSYISVFTGGCNPSTLRCAAAFYSRCGKKFYFDTMNETAYHVLVQTPNRARTSVSIISVPPVPANDLCINAQPVVIGSSLAPIKFNTSYATLDSDVENDCFYGNQPGLVSRPSYPGVWFIFNGTGRRIAVRACAVYERQFMSIFTGGCNQSSRQCAAYTNKSCSPEGFIFNTTLGTIYHVLVQSVSFSSEGFNPSYDYVDFSIFSASSENNTIPVPTPVSVSVPVPVPLPVSAPAPARAPSDIPVLVPLSGSCPAQVTGYTLVDALRGTDIMPLRSYAMKDMPKSLSIRVDVLKCSPKMTASVYIDFDGMTRCERFIPYTVFGDVASVNRKNETVYGGKAISVGRHIINATPYTGDKCRGAAGKNHTLVFTVVK